MQSFRLYVVHFAGYLAANWARIGLVVIVLIGVLLRYRCWVIYGGFSPSYQDWAMDNYFGGLTPGYTATAKALLAGEWSRIAQIYPVGYGAIIAFLHTLGADNLQVFRLVQITVDALGGVLTFYICRELRCPRLVSLFGAACYALAPWLLFGSTFVLAESILPILTVTVLALLMRAKRTGSLHNWVLVGLAASATALMRSEMIVLFLPVSVLAVICSPGGRRLRAIAAVMAAFWLPWLAVATTNYIHFDRFGSANNVFYYALFSGLGQVENEHEYYADDARASRFLQSRGLVYHSKEAEQHWKSVYLDAWKNHPGHVLKTIGFRFHRILFQPDQAMPATELAYYCGFLALILTTVLLIYHRRWCDAFIVAGPMVIALGSLGLLYVEPRYVRYASISYLLAFPVALSYSFAAVEARLYKAGFSKLTGTSVAITAAALVFAFPVFEFFSHTQMLDFKARDAIVGHTAQAQIARGITTPQSGTNLALRKEARGAKVARSRDERIRVEVSKIQGGYQAMAQFDSVGAQFVFVDYQIRPVSVAGDLGILASDGSFFFRQRVLPEGKLNSGRLFTRIFGDSVHAVLQSASAEDATLEVERLQAVAVCVEQNWEGGITQRFLFWLFPAPGLKPTHKLSSCSRG